MTMRKYRYGICGAFDFDENATGGQSVKTREFYYGLCDQIGKENIRILESSSYKKNSVLFLFRFALLIKQCEAVVIFPAQKGIKIFAPLCKMLKESCKTRTYYNVIGGWLAQIVDENPKLKKSLLNFDAILVETDIMKRELEIRGITNVRKLKNFKRLTPIEPSRVAKVEKPVQLCYFSRVTKMKGIADAVRVVNRINKDEIRCILDIYGPVTDGYDEEFELLKKEFGERIAYKGKINPSDSVNTIAKYDIQLFPTHYKTEGIPGAILDSYFAGVPVVAARWNSFSDIIIEGQTGNGFEINDVDDFYLVLDKLIKDKEKIQKMKYRALKEAKEYTPKIVIEEFLQISGDDYHGH